MFRRSQKKKLTLLTNKTLMTHDLVASAILNEKFRNDALHVSFDKICSSYILFL